MNDLIEKVEVLKKELDKNKTIINIKKLNKEVKNDKKLMELLNKYKKTHNLNIKKEIISYPLFEQYKKEETEINYLILEINKRLKKISNKGKCDL